MRIALGKAVFGLALACADARAGDFTGAYAGVSAGYAFGRGGRQAGPAILPDSGAAVDRGLPPSAESAAQAMRRSPWRPSRSPR